MSSTTLLVARNDGELHPYASYKNSWHGAMLIWNGFAERYNTPFNLINEESMKKLWALAGDAKVPLHDRITLATTYDRFIVYSQDFPRLVASLRETAKWLPAHCHITKQADDIEKIMELNANCSDPDLHIIAVGWNQTSVVDVWETGKTRKAVERDENGQEEEYLQEVPYNLNTDKEHNNLFEEVK